MFPIKPGEQNHLSANMGELRSNHFHAGLDIKTDKKTGYPVYASAEGYVSRIRASSYGYGYAVYITHPNNLVTVYAHLDKFNQAIGDYLLKKQYEKQTFEIEVRPAKGELPVKKGEVIGLAGNSGSSQAPHLHYEIRDTTDRVLNPAECGFKELTDNLPPVFDRIAIVPMNIDSRINGEFERKEFKVSLTGNSYSIASPISANGLIALELKAYDRKNFAHNTYGINKIRLYVNDTEIFHHNLSSFTFEETRYINEHINYQVFSNTGRRFERLYIADGNKMNSYKCSDNLRGKFQVKDGKVSKIKITIEDDFGNKSTLSFDIRHESLSEKLVPPVSAINTGIKTEILENILKINTVCSGDPGAFLYCNSNSISLKPAYLKNGSLTYLYDLRKGLPDSIKIGNQKEQFNFIRTIIPGKEQAVSIENLNVKFSPKCLADTLYMTYYKSVSNGQLCYQIHDQSVSLYDTVSIMINPENGNEEKCLAYCTNRGKPDCEAGMWNGNKIEVKTRNLGKFTLLKDTTAPIVRFISNIGNSVKFTVFDDLSGIDSWKAYLNGQWILMNYDHKKNLMWSERLDKTVPLKGEFIFEVKDRAGNVNIYKTVL